MRLPNTLLAREQRASSHTALAFLRGRGFARAETLGVQGPGCAVHISAHGIGKQSISLGERVKNLLPRLGTIDIEKGGRMTD